MAGSEGTARRASRRLRILAVLGAVLFGWACAPEAPPGAERDRPPSPAAAGDIYRALPPATRLTALKARQRALETLKSGRSLTWRDGAHDGVITPARTYRTAAGIFCRQFTESLGALAPARPAIACRGGDGIWRIARPKG